MQNHFVFQFFRFFQFFQWKVQWKVFMILLAVLALMPASASARDTTRPATPRITVGNVTVSGVFLDSAGSLVAPAVAGSDAEWKVEFEGEHYRATVVSHQPKYNLVILRIERQKPFPAAILMQERIASTAKLFLMGLDEKGAAIEKPISYDLIGVRRLKEEGRFGSFYELRQLQETPRDGAVLVDATTGGVYGMLLPSQGANGERYVLFASSISERAAEWIKAIVTKEPGKQRVLVYTDHVTPANPHSMEFVTAFSSHDAAHERAAQDFRRNSGFQINGITAPQVADGFAYFGSTAGTLSCINLKTMQREWPYPGRPPLLYAVIYPPAIGQGRICVVHGDLALLAQQADDPVWRGAFDAVTSLGGSVGQAAQSLEFLIPKKTERAMRDFAFIDCIDLTGNYKWHYPTRFVGQPRIVGNRVIFAGVGALGVLNLADGKPIWAQYTDRRHSNPTFHVLGGADNKQMWVLSVETRLAGDRTKHNPLRLEQDPRPVHVECYDLADGRKAVWRQEIKTSPKAPALSGSMVLSADNTVCYGAVSKEVFALEAATGKVLWSKSVFSGNEQHFGGSIAYNDSALFVTSNDNKLLALNSVDGMPLWTFETKAALCMPLVHQGIVYVGSQDTWIYALEVGSGKTVWKFETSGKVTGQPCIVDNKLYCTTDDGQLTAIDLPQQ